MSSAQGKFGRKDWMVAGFLFAATLALRVPFRSQMAYHWDSAQFALAINQYDIRLSQPHAPGYFLYVMLGRAVNCLVGDPHASLVWISVVFGGALTAIAYLLGTAMFGRWGGITAALLAMTSPQTWFHSCVALTYIVDGFLTCAIVLLLWRAAQRGGTYRDAVLIGALLAIIGGVRQQSVLGLLPLIVFAFCQFRQARAAKLVLATIVAVGLGISWFVPMVRTSGGIGTYWEIVRLHAAFNAPATALGGGWSALLDNIARAAAFCWNGLVLGALVLITALLHRAFRMTDKQKRDWSHHHTLALRFLVFWLVPMIVFGTLVGFTKQPGYVLSYLPGWFLLVGAVVASLRTAPSRVFVVSALCIANTMTFFAWPARFDEVLFKKGLTARAIREHDARLSQMVAGIRRFFKPKEVVVCHADEFYLYGLRHFQLYLPEYENYQLAIDSTVVHPAGKPIWRTRNGLLEFVAGPDLKNKKGCVLCVPPGQDVKIFEGYFSLSSITCLTNGETSLYFLPAEAVHWQPGA